MDVGPGDLIADGALFVMNHSGGKDSQAMLIEMLKIIPRAQLLVVHACLGEVEWPGARELAEKQAADAGLPFIVAKPVTGFLEMVERRFATRPDVPSWPSAKHRQCTSDLKRGPLDREIRRYAKANAFHQVVSCMGLRAQESASRAKRATFSRNERNSIPGRAWYEWNPIHGMTTDQVFATIRDAGQQPHPAYAAGNDRLSCVFCIFGSKTDIQNGAKHRPELAASIQAEGLLQPIVVRPLPGEGFEIVAGECRWRAHKLLGLHTIPADVREMDERQRDVAAIVENLQRRDVSPLEEARALRRLVDQGMTPEELATSTGAPLFKIQWRLSLFNLDPEILTLLESGAVTLQQGQELARMPRHADQRRMLQRINRGEITGHRTLHNAIDAIVNGTTAMDLFGDAAPKVSDADVQVLKGLERKVERLMLDLSGGWKDGECIVAAKVSPDRARLVADQLKAIRLTVARMESDLRQTVSQADVVLNLEDKAA